METDPKKSPLDIPAESNSDKRTNSLDKENNEIDPGSEEFGKLFNDNDEEEEDEVD
jgi:hypothetical protein